MGKDIGGRDIISGAIAVMIFCLGIYVGAMTATEHAERHEQTAINNAVTAVELRSI